MTQPAETRLVTEARLPILVEELGIGGGGGVETVSGTVTLDATGEPVREFFTTGATTFSANGTTVQIAAHTAVVWRRAGVGSWGYQEVPEEWTTPTPTPDTQAPTAGTLAVSAADVTADLSVTGATDDRGVTGYAFQVNGGAWSAWQAGPTYTATGLSASTEYQFRHKVRDAAGNETQGTAVSKTTASKAVRSLSEEILALSPVGYWKLDETTGTTAVDSSGNSRNGTYSGAVALNARNGAPVFSGGYVEVGDAADFSMIGSTAGYTVFALVYADDTSTTTLQRFVAKGAGSGFEWQFQAAQPALGRVEASLMNKAGSPAASSSKDGIYTAGRWDAYCATIPAPAAGAKFTLYQNSGTPLASPSYVGSDANFATAEDTTSPLRIGNRGDGVGPMKGAIRHVALFRKELTAAQVDTLMLAAKQGGLIA